MTADPHGRAFKYEGENKQREVKDVTNAGQIVGTYFYDGDGRRVKKVTADIDGEWLADISYC